jgi:23S rRNA pseudouridine2605 synthase
MSDPQGRRTVADFLQDSKERVFPVGRLDYNTEGLLLLTNDGELAQKLMHPSHEVNKTYVVKVPGIVPQEKLDLLRVGVKLEDGMTAPAFVNLIAYDHEKNSTLFNITIHEGRNRQVRRMCDFIGFPVRELKRTKMANLNVNGLGKGRYRELTEQELAELKKVARI